MTSRGKHSYADSIFAIHDNYRHGSKLISETKTAIAINQNRNIMNIQNCPILSILTLNNTCVQTIKNCKSLHSLSMTINRGMKLLKSNSIRELNLYSCADLQTLIVPNAKSIILNKVRSLCKVVAPSATTLSITNMDIDDGVDIIHAMANLKSLTLDNVDGVSINDIAELELSTLIIKNNNITSLSDLRDIDNIVIENCSSLTNIKCLSGIKTITINHCPSLRRVRLVDAEKIQIDKCGNLVDVSNITCHEMSISFCFSLLSLPVSIIECLKVDSCPYLTSMDVSSGAKSIIVNNCHSFEQFNFECNSAFAHSDLSIEIYGENSIEHIYKWYVAKLTVVDSSALVSIENVHNLTHLTLMNCPELLQISGLCATSLLINSCDSLRFIREMFSLIDLSIMDCGDLEQIDLGLTKLENVKLIDCEKLFAVINCKFVETLTIKNSACVIPKHLNPTSMVDIKDMPLLPDTTGKEALVINNRLDELLRASVIIGKYMFKRMSDRKYLKFIQKTLNDQMCNCVICQDDLDGPFNTAFTKCDHMFHVDCLYKWLQYKQLCPLCNCVI